VVVIVILCYGVNVPYAEQWDFVAFFVAQELGGLRWADIWAPHNEHRMVVPKLLMLGLAPLTGWNVRAEMLMSAALAFLSLLVLLALARPALREAGPWTGVWARFTLSVLVFSLAQVGNWLWGWQVQWFLAVLAAILAIAMATWSLERRNPWPHVVIAALAALVCQYSLASGTVIWALCALMLAFHARRARLLGFWLALAFGSTALYAVGYERPQGLPSLGVAIAEPVALLRYAGFYLAGPFGRSAGIGAAVAAAFAVLAWIVCRRHWRRPELFAPWIALAGFAVANALLTGIGRLGMGAQQAQTTRYVTISLLLAAALVPLGVLVFSAAPEGRWPYLRRLAGIAGAALLTIWVVSTDIRRLRDIREFNRAMTEGRDCVLDIGKASDDCLRNLHPHPATVRQRALQLMGLKLSMFADQRP
jgi:hypothetical protein